MKILKAKPSDTKKIYLLRKNIISKINSKDYRKEVVKYLCDRNKPKEIFRKIKERDMFCAWNGNKLLGTVDLEGNKIGGLFVRTDYIGKGIGKKLMDFIENYAKKKAIKAVKLYPTKTAYNFYIKRGYKKVKNNSWEANGIKVKGFLMKKRLK